MKNNTVKSVIEFRSDDNAFDRARKILKRAGFVNPERINTDAAVAEGIQIYMDLDRRAFLKEGR